ncbi:MAG TPA: hypothetical protein VFU22_01140 [Roseiflexaceae bacterium]|nr:hypothetical protein [Roseiflexaceae bacterium]
MSRERIVWAVALLLVAGLGFYSGQTVGVRAGEQNRAQAMQEFFGQRGGGQAGQGGGQASGQAGGGFRGQGGGLAGTVRAVEGNTITIATRTGQTVKAQLAADGTVRKQVEAQLSDLTVGEQVVAIGTQSGDTFQATSIQIGGFGGQGSGQSGERTP